MNINEAIPYPNLNAINSLTAPELPEQLEPMSKLGVLVTLLFLQCMGQMLSIAHYIWIQLSTQIIQIYVYFFSVHSKPKREALVHLKPTLPDDLRQKYGVTITDYQSANPTITFDNPNEKAYDEVKALVSSLQLIEVPLSGEYGLDRLEQVRAEVRPAAVYICAPESVQRKSVFLCAFDLALLNKITPKVQQLFAVTTVQFDGKPEEGVFLKRFNKAFVDNLPAKVSFNEDGRMTLAGGDDAVQISIARIRELLQGLYSRKFTFMCSPKFLPRIEQVVIPYGMEESSFKYYTQKGGGGGGHKWRGSQAKSGGSEEIAVYIFCRNEQVFQRVSELLGRFKPSSRTFHFNHKGVDEVIKSMKSQLEKDYFVEVFDKGPGSLLIHGLDPDEIQKCHDIIKEKVETTLIVTKYEPVNLQLYPLLKLYEPELAEIRRDCKELTVLPPNKEHEESCLIKIRGTIAQVEDVKSRLSSGLLSMNMASTSFDLLCPQWLFGMWCKRWNQVKEQEAKRSKVSIKFRKAGTADGADTKSLKVHFEIAGTDNNVMQEVAGAIISEGTVTEEKTFSLSANGCGCLLKAKRDKKLDFLNNTIVYVGNINKQANTITLCAPKELSDNLDTAEEQVRKFVGERANTSQVISSKDPVVGLILSSPTRSQQYMTTANILAKDHKVSVRVLKNGVRITGTEASIASVKMLINATVIEAIERTIMEKRVSVKPQYSSFLSSPDFYRFLSRLESDLSVICSYPRAGKTSKLVASSLIHMEDQGQYVKVDICKGSVVHELVDAIVNAANEDLKHIGGLAKAILDAGGPGIQTESDDHVRTKGKVRPGSAVCLSAGYLPCKRIVHAVGPRWNGGQRGEEQTLYYTIFHSLEAANKESLSSIAFPAIGTGVFNVPLDICARASLKAVQDFCIANPNTTIQNVKFVLFQQDAVDAFKPLLVSGISGEYQHGSASRPHAKNIALVERSPITTSTSPFSDWQWLNDSSCFVSYSTDVSSKLSSAYRANPKGSANVLINGVTYDISFVHMLQTNHVSGYSRRIQHITATSSSVEWQYQNDVGSYTPYKAGDSASIENMYQAKKPDQLSINGKAYTFDFTQMCQINVTTGFKRPIHRQTHTQPSAGASVAAAALEPLGEEDESESESKDIVLTLRGPYDSLEAAETKVRSKLDSAWKKRRIDKLPENMTTDLKKKISHIAKRNDVICIFEEKAKSGLPSLKVLNLEGTSFKVQAAVSAIQEEILTFHLSTSQDEVKYPDEWEPQQKTTELFTVQQGSTEWQRVEGKFALTMGAGKIKAIARIQNKWVWEKYATQKKRLDRKNSGLVNEMELFHGTRGNNPKVIYDGEEGFDMRYSSQGMWGMANYFAVNASYSHGYAYTSGGNRQMFLVKVLTGDSFNCSSNSSLRMPPTKTAAQGGDIQFEQMKYDTVNGTTGGSQVFMTYDNDKAYPAYLITYT